MNHNMTFYGGTVCFIGAHPDDIELGCGALISDIVDQPMLSVSHFRITNRILLNI